MLNRVSWGSAAPAAATAVTLPGTWKCQTFVAAIAAIPARRWAQNRDAHRSPLSDRPSIPDIAAGWLAESGADSELSPSLCCANLSPLPDCPVPALQERFAVDRRQWLSPRTQSPKTAASEAGWDRAERP